jgi:hypothetical protein
MMDASPMYPKLWHAVKTDRTPDLKGKAPHSTRTQRPTRYYLIDLGISRKYENREDAVNEPIIVGGDKSAPEHQGDVYECDPFPTDVYYLGNMIREHFLEVRPLFSWYLPPSHPLRLFRRSSGSISWSPSSRTWSTRNLPFVPPCPKLSLAFMISAPLFPRANSVLVS